MTWTKQTNNYSKDNEGKENRNKLRAIETYKEEWRQQEKKS
jgi:hypothetical protein